MESRQKVLGSRIDARYPDNPSGSRSFLSETSIRHNRCVGQLQRLRARALAQPRCQAVPASILDNSWNPNSLSVQTNDPRCTVIDLRLLHPEVIRRTRRPAGGESRRAPAVRPERASLSPQHDRQFARCSPPTPASTWWRRRQCARLLLHPGPDGAPERRLIRLRKPPSGSGVSPGFVAMRNTTSSAPPSSRAQTSRSTWKRAARIASEARTFTSSACAQHPGGTRSARRQASPPRAVASRCSASIDRSRTACPLRPVPRRRARAPVQVRSTSSSSSPYLRRSRADRFDSTALVSSSNAGSEKRCVPRQLRGNIGCFDAEALQSGGDTFQHAVRRPASARTCASRTSGPGPPFVPRNAPTARSSPRRARSAF